MARTLSSISRVTHPAPFTAVLAGGDKGLLGRTWAQCTRRSSKRAGNSAKGSRERMCSMPCCFTDLDRGMADGHVAIARCAGSDWGCDLNSELTCLFSIKAR